MTRALYHARELAMNRMEEEAEALGADGIVGVRLTVKPGRSTPCSSSGTSIASGRTGRRGVGFPRSSTRLGRQLAVVAQRRRRHVDPLLPADGLGSPSPWPPGRAPRTQAAYGFGQNAAEFLAIGTRRAPPRRRALQEQARQAVPVRSLRPGLLAPHPLGLPSRGLRDGQLRLLRAAAAPAGARHAELRARRVHPRALRRARARDRAPAGRGRGAGRHRHRRRHVRRA